MLPRKDDFFKIPFKIPIKILCNENLSSNISIFMESQKCSNCKASRPQQSMKNGRCVNCALINLQIITFFLK